MNTNPKGSNNPTSWEKIENAETKTIIVEEKSFLDEEDIETVEGEEVFSLEEPNTSNDYGDVLQLTAYENGALSERTTDFVVAEYTDINLTEIDKKHQLEAKRFVSRITKFVIDFNDVQLSEEHKSYIKQVGQFQLQHLSDLLSMVSINKLMLNNIISRVNATQAEDYAIINTYNNLANQHLKLIKELQNTYKTIPQTMKKMKAEITCNQELEEVNGEDELITENLGDTHFNNGKQLIRKILEEKERKTREALENK